MNLQALETRDTYLAAQMFSSLADSHVGIAGHVGNKVRIEQERNVRSAGAYVERSYKGESYATRCCPRSTRCAWFRIDLLVD